MRWLLLAALCLGGCYTVSIKNGRAAAPATVEHEEMWHSGVVAGIAELSGPYAAPELCPQGWARIDVETGFLHGLVEFATGGLYNPQAVTVRCAKAE